MLQNVYLSRGIKSIGSQAFFTQNYYYCSEYGDGLIEDLYFSGSEEQWNKFLSDLENDLWGDNEWFVSVENIYFNTGFSPVEIAGVAVRNGKVVIAIDKRNLPDGMALTAVTYNGEALTDTANAINGRVELNGDGVTRVKLFCWDSLESMRPLCEAKEAEVTQ